MKRFAYSHSYAELQYTGITSREASDSKAPNIVVTCRDNAAKDLAVGDKENNTFYISAKKLGW